MTKWFHRLEEFDSANRFGIKTAFITFLGMLLLMVSYFSTRADFIFVIGFAFTFIVVIINVIVAMSVFINLLIRSNRLIETFFTLYMMLLNIPIFTGMVLLNTHLNGKIIL
ncbi:MAG: hypothetical protein ACSHWW_05020 [Nonlabens sp.]|uniref:hypothetical protein n=1 Tax=Nonlabens sp. TaxID=1888209 RepID=UPI003EF75D5E